MFEWSKSDAIVLPVLLVLIVGSAVLYRFLIAKDDQRLRKIPLRGLAVLIVLLEASKQFEYLVWTPYNTYALPLHFCSTFIWLMPLAQFTYGKAERFFKPMPLVYSFIVVALIYVYPRVLLGASTATMFDNFFSSHTILYHHTIVAYFVYSIVLCDYEPRKIDLVPLFVGIAFYTAYATPAAYALNVNYVNILKSDFPPFEAIRLAAGKVSYAFGQIVYDTLLFTFAVGASFAIWAVIYLIFKKAKKSPKAAKTD